MTDTLPNSAIDTITTMAFGRKVLMIGTNYGQDVLALANSAQVLAIMSLPRDGAFEAHITKTAQLKAALEERGRAANVLVHAVPWDEATSVYLVDQFDLAVINPVEIGEDDPGQLINHVVQFAESLIVVEPSGGTWWEQVTAAVRDQDMICSGDGAIIVARPMPTEPSVRRD